MYISMDVYAIMLHPLEFLQCMMDAHRSTNAPNIRAVQRRACCFAFGYSAAAHKLIKPQSMQPYYSLSTLHAPMTSISHALYLSSAVLFPVPKALLTTWELSHQSFAELQMHRWNTLSLRPPHSTLPHIRHISFHYNATGEKKKNWGAAVLKRHLIYSPLHLYIHFHWHIHATHTHTTCFLLKWCNWKGK